jgi:phospholipase/carboxylesterase
MNMPPRWALGLLVLVSLACTQDISANAHPPAQPALTYVERLTAGAKAEETLPLVVAIHGLGDTPENFVELLDDFDVKARVIAPRAPDPWGEGSSWYPIDDEIRKPRILRARAQQVSDLITQLTRLRKTRGKPVVTGFSQGGVLSFAMAAYHSGQLRAALPMAGSLPAALLPAQKPAAGFELAAFHGKADRRIPFAEGETTVSALKAQGYRATLHAFEGVGHGIPMAMRAGLYASLRKLTAAEPH